MTVNRRIRALASVVLLFPAAAACATIMQGSTQSVGISSSPTGAQVFVNGVQRGVTPMVADLARKETHMLAVRLDGYQPYELALSRSVSGWVAGNILFGGIIGLAFDAISGGMYKLTPDQIVATMGPGAAMLDGTEDALLLAIVLRAESDWEKIGQLERD